jgi:hypothetical protein
MRRLDPHSHFYQQVDGSYGGEYDMDGETVDVEFTNEENYDLDNDYDELDTENGENSPTGLETFNKILSTMNQINAIKDTGVTEIINNLDKTNVAIDLTSQFEKLEYLKKKVDEATKTAKKAQKACDLHDGGDFIDRLFGSKWDAIEATQEALKKIATSLQANADAQKLTYSYMSTTNETCKNLFALGIISLANNRMVVNKIKMQLEQASEEELSAYARAELQSVIDQLVAQEDLAKKYEKLKEQIKTQEETIKKLQENQDSKNIINYIAIVIALGTMVFTFVLK